MGGNNKEHAVKLIREAKERLLQQQETRQMGTLDHAIDSLSQTPKDYTVWARALRYVNEYINIPEDQIKDAANAYDEIATHLVDTLSWPAEAIRIFPQGSSSTRTLIRYPNSSKFDIDAVCAVDIDYISEKDPMTFFETIGEALTQYDAEAKRRCWRLPFPNRPYYLEFTPSVPIQKIGMSVAEDSYQHMALAVVDRPTRDWKTSNPEGFSNWINEQAEKKIIFQMLHEKSAITMDSARIDPVPEQEVELSDMLRTAIRLFKRHRDMCIYRNEFTKDEAPISIIIVTLLTHAYEGLVELAQRYAHPIELLSDLARLLPHLVEKREGKWWIANPTVHGENFAERWNDGKEGEKRQQKFELWCSKLDMDLKLILQEKDTEKVQKLVYQIFGCTGSSPGTTGLTGGILAPARPTQTHRPTQTKGLA